jgi:hypothetical protein
MAYVQLLDSIIQKKQSKLAVVNVNKGKCLGNEVFKMIVEMAYEMNAVDKVNQRVESQLLKLSYEMSVPTVFRNQEEVGAEVVKALDIVHTNKKKYHKMDGADEEVGYVFKSKIPLSVSGHVPVLLRLEKYVIDGHVSKLACVYVNGYEIANNVVPNGQEGTIIIANAVRDYLTCRNNGLREKFNDIFEASYYGRRPKNFFIWEKRLLAMKDAREGAFLKKLSMVPKHLL